MRIAREEVFGPVLSIIPWSSEEELIALANNSPYGLAAGIWTKSTAKALRIADLLEVGTVWINTYGMFDVAVPFGGRKLSGHGRELGEEALAAYLQWKSVWVDLEPRAQKSGQSMGR
jgi:acyl-CoA reductase-like NAD-dependent aldehyde dehydrogenase